MLLTNRDSSRSNTDSSQRHRHDSSSKANQIRPWTRSFWSARLWSSCWYVFIWERLKKISERDLSLGAGFLLKNSQHREILCKCDEPHIASMLFLFATREWLCHDQFSRSHRWLCIGPYRKNSVHFRSQRVSQNVAFPQRSFSLPTI